MRYIRNVAETQLVLNLYALLDHLWQDLLFEFPYGFRRIKGRHS